jgi:hypothetical protein
MWSASVWPEYMLQTLQGRIVSSSQLQVIGDNCLPFHTRLPDAMNGPGCFRNGDRYRRMRKRAIITTGSTAQIYLYSAVHSARIMAGWLLAVPLMVATLAG